MCLVSYIPSTNGYIICSNRDESPKRSQAPLAYFQTLTGNILCPVDKKGGSWIICSEDGRAICILNGAFKIHKRRPEYRMSRGLMMKAFFNYGSTAQFVQDFDFQNMEPFTMVIKDKNGLYEFRWDGRYKHILHLSDDSLHVWSSCTLYTPEVQEQRERAYRKAFASIIPNAKSIIDLQKNTNLGDRAIDFVMNREDRVATISITLLERRDSEFILSHHDLRNGGKEELGLKLKDV